MFKLSSMFVEVKANATPFEKAMDQVHAKLTRTDVAVGTMVGSLGSMFAKVGGEHPLRRLQ